VLYGFTALINPFVAQAIVCTKSKSLMFGIDINIIKTINITANAKFIYPPASKQTVRL
jgi:hypothetical protein